MSKSEERRSRRDFIKTAAVGAVGAGLSSCASTDLTEPPNPGPIEDPAPAPTPAAPADTFDVAIVGGGVSGCYAAYRLLFGALDPNAALGRLKAQNGGKLSIGIFDYSGRVAGRLLSAELPEVPPLSNSNPDYLNFAEFGGFRFQPQMHILRDLGNLLFNNPPGAKSTDWYQPFPVDEATENFYYVRGKQFRLAQLNGYPQNGITVPYNLRPSEQLSPGGLNSFIIDQAFGASLPSYDFATNTPAPPADIAPPSNPSAPPPDTPGTYVQPTIPATSSTYPHNGYSYLRYLYQQAFRLGDLAEQNGDQATADTFWKLTRQYRLAYQDALHTAVFKERSLIDWPWWSLMQALLSEEALHFIEDTAGYNSLWTQGSVSFTVREDFFFANPNDLFGLYPPSSVEDTAWHHVKKGYSDFVEQLYDQFLTAGGNIPQGGTEAIDGLNHQLVRFSPTNEGDPSAGYDLLFYRRESGTITPAQAAQQCAEDPTKCRHVHAQYVVLAMPKRSLELLDQNTPFFRDVTVDRLLDSVLDNRSNRFFMAYRTPWWKTATTGDPTYPPLTRGRSNTDLPIRQFYYWLTNEQNGPSIVLASYTNARAQRFWHALEQPYDDAFDDLDGAVVPPPGLGGSAPRPVDARGKGPRVATRTMAKMAHQQLAEVVYGMPYDEILNPPAEPYYAHYQDWSKDPWGAGWHGWKAGQDEYELIPQIIQPLPTDNVYVVGECYSNIPGWVQGALNVAEVMLQTRLGATWPAWLSKGGTWLGPGSEGLNPLA